MDKDRTIEKVMARLLELEKRIEKLEGPGGSGAPTNPSKAKKLSAKEFLMTKNISADTQRVLALAYYLERVEQVDPFNVQDLESAFRAAREKLPVNMNDAVNKNIGRGFLMEAASKKDSKKAWHLTSTGEQHVEKQMNR